ncbi:hypothetical protein [Streptomyces sp. WAC01280]|uniref:hypothetical protein n=1 Tax=Streptomyces sp. WAC01280 TaxID=2487424 RepID=UPI000F7B5E6D|nr:hypothetical protein [Streptomyces sp. WAC01280]RSS58758.1 hypothetical protein EF909_02030 [Streptomyces sp. WAC01280]
MGFTSAWAITGHTEEGIANLAPRLLAAGLLQGWGGTFLLTPAQVAESLPRIERAFAFTPAERSAAESQDWLDYADGEECVLDGPLRVWRTAAHRGMGLCGLSTHLT